MKYIDAEKLYKKVEELMAKFAELEKETETDDMSLTLSTYYQGKRKMCSEILTLIDSLQQEQPDDLASLISEATNVAKRIVDRDSFYNSLPQNLRNKYTSNAWREILEALSTMKEPEQPEVDLEKFTEKIKTFQARYKHPESISVKGAMAFMARMFYQYPNVARQWYDGLPKATIDDARKEE